MGTESSRTPEEPAQAASAGPPALTQRGKAGVTVVAVLLVIWFLIAWLILDRHVLDAAGESVGVAFVIGIVASLLGAMRRTGTRNGDGDR